MRANFRIGMLSEHDKFRDHKVEGKRPIDLDIELSGVILACFFQNVECSLMKEENSAILDIETRHHAEKKKRVLYRMKEFRVRL